VHLSGTCQSGKNNLGIWHSSPVRRVGGIGAIDAINQEPVIREQISKEVAVDGPYNKDSTVKTSGSRGVHGKFHAHF
jgi:hypothetical protein